MGHECTNSVEEDETGIDEYDNDANVRETILI